LRGVAALVVVVHHAVLVVPSMAALVDVKGHAAQAPQLFSVPWWLYRTPLRVVWAGQEAVLLFFVLSGLVLTLPVLRGWSRADWRTYYPRRLARLYIPVWVSLVLALLLVLLVPRDVTSASAWLAAHPQPTGRSLAFDTTLLFGSSNLNSPLWSLRWEIWFSLLLPLLITLAVAARVRRWWPVAVATLAVVSGLASLPVVGDVVPGAFLTQGLLVYLPVFGIGVVLALAGDRVHALTVRLDGSARPRLAWAATGIGGIVAALSPTYVDIEGSSAGTVVLRAVSLLGVTALVFLALGRPGRLGAGPVQWLGSRSFSLYLVHEPLVVAVALLAGSSMALWGLLGLPMLALVLVAAEVFHRFVERPSHRFARSLGAPARTPGVPGTPPLVAAPVRRGAAD
jgi:peptidoglycan/LPS O-acetylase OafA/YrhL